MPQRRRLTMRQLRHLLRLSSDGVSVRDISDVLGIARSTVQDGIGEPLQQDFPGLCLPTLRTMFLRVAFRPSWRQTGSSPPS